MLLKLLALFTIVPLVELAILIPLGMQIGLWPTIGLVVGTALLGGILAKLEGARAWARIKEDLGSGKLPGDSLLDGLAILIAGVFLVTPGVLTDVVAILLLIPPARKPVRLYAKKRFQKMLADDGSSVSFLSSSGSSWTETAHDPKDTGGARPFQAPFATSDDAEIIDVTPPRSDEDSNSSGPESDPLDSEHW